VLYLALLILTSATVLYDRIGDRLLAPVFVPLLVLLLGASDRWIFAEGRVRRDRAYLLTPPELATATQLRELLRFEDGAIYSVERRESPVVSNTRATKR
jgi:hypothetical protein